MIKIAEIRFFAVEHPIALLIATGFLYYGKKKVFKENKDSVKHKKVLLNYSLSILTLVIAIPWSFSTYITR